VRNKLAEESLEMLIQWLKDGGNVGIHGKSDSVLCVDANLIMHRCNEQQSKSQVNLLIQPIIDILSDLILLSKGQKLKRGLQRKRVLS